MRRKISYILSCFLLTQIIFNVSKGQTTENINRLKQIIKSADSVVLISHQSEFVNPDEIADKTDTVKDYKIWDNGKINRQVIIESQLLLDSDKINLSKILLRQVLKKRLQFAECDDPQHSIIIYKKNKQSYIDICFGCRRIHTSTDIEFSESYLDERKWQQLESFFKRKGLIKIFKEQNL
jgi:hypothetical protein